MVHPLDCLSPHASAWLLGVLFLLTVICSTVLDEIGQPLKTAEAPRGIVSFELARHRAKSEAIVRSWEGVRESAKNSLRLDFVFIPLYSTTLTLLCVMAGHFFQRNGWSDLAAVAAVLAWYQWFAGLLDVVENCALLRLLNLSPPFPEILPWVAGLCAAVKFLLILLGLVCFLVAVACSLVI